MTTKAHVEVRYGDAVATRDIFSDGYPQYVGGIIKDFLRADIGTSVEVEALADQVFPRTRAEAEKFGFQPGLLEEFPISTFLI